MDKKKIKGIIAREGIILLVIIVVGFFINLQGIYVRNIFIIYAGAYLCIFGYPIYLLIRFIIWALRTLRKR